MAARRWWFLGAWVVIVSVTATLWAKQGIVHLKDGSQLTGDITDDPSNPTTVTVVISGIETTIQRSNIDSIEYQASIDDQFKDRMSKLDPKDVDGRLDLAQWACDNNRYDLARQAVLQALD